jgi:hypothetical protein
MTLFSKIPIEVIVYRVAYKRRYKSYSISFSIEPFRPRISRWAIVKYDLSEECGKRLYKIKDKKRVISRLPQVFVTAWQSYCLLLDHFEISGIDTEKYEFQIIDPWDLE